MNHSIGLTLFSAWLALAVLPRPALAAAPSDASRSNQVYIVQLDEPPATAYNGTIPDYAATRPASVAGARRKIDPEDPKVVRYMGYLSARHDAVLAAAGGGRKLYSYGYVYNGFAAEMTAAQASRLGRSPGVLAVSKDGLRRQAMSITPSFLGLTGNGGFWSQTGATGEGVVIGMIDSGVWPEHPSFADRGYAPIPGWRGRCVPGEDFRTSHCNGKLIGARWFNEGLGGNAAVNELFPEDFISARDFDSHGTHVGSIAAGNADVPVTGTLTTAETVGPVVISGVAPRARVAVYKVFWGGRARESDLVAAIERAVADGVDVINYSVTGSTTSFVDPPSLALMQASAAGVFVSAAACNDGPAENTVCNLGPWVTTVAAGSHPRQARGLVTLGNGAVLVGRAAPSQLPSAPLVDAVAAGLPGADAASLAACFGAADGAVVLDPARVAGRIVICDRGGNGRINKARAVQQAGGVGMVLTNTDTEGLVYGDLHPIPTVHLFFADRSIVKAYAATPGASASMRGDLVFDRPAPETAFFSSRGPITPASGDLLKPDLMAPGYEILAGVAPFQGDGVLFYVQSGTSMATPHVAGLAALFKQLKPEWSPMAIKSALMTTAGDTIDSVGEAERIFRQGAGHVRPQGATRPGLVFDSGPADWLGFLCGVGQSSSPACPALRLDPSDFNVASVAIGDLAGSQTVKRRLSNVSGNPATFTASSTGLAGLGLSVSPSALTLAAGQTGEVAITIKRSTAAFAQFSGGQLTWSDGLHKVRVPVVVRPIALAAPAEVGGSYAVKFGYTGAFSAVGRGLVPAVVTAGTVADDPTDGPCSLTSVNSVHVPVTVPAGTSHARFELFDADVTAGTDIDLCVYRGQEPVGRSESATSAEQVNLVNPAAGAYTVVVHGWGVVGSSGFRLHRWLLGTGPASQMVVTAPPVAVSGRPGVISISPQGLVSGQRYLGAVAYGGESALPAPTLVRIDP